MNILFFLRVFVLYYIISISINYVVGDEIEYIKTLIISFLFSLSFSLAMHRWNKKKAKVMSNPKFRNLILILNIFLWVFFLIISLKYIHEAWWHYIISFIMASFLVISGVKLYHSLINKSY